MNQTVRFLWVSDIHYRHDFLAEGLLNQRNTEFCNTVKEYLKKISLIPDDNKLDYFIISGDLGYKGSKDDYDLLHINIIKPLLEVFKAEGQKPIILCCPGNHDVNRKANKFFKDFIGKIEEFIEIEEKLEERELNLAPAEIARGKARISRQKFLDEYTVEKAKDVFKDYSEYVKTLLPSEGNENNLVAGYRNNECLYGYVFDESNKVIINILNSAWFSLGDGFDSLIQNYFQEMMEKEINLNLDDEQFKNNFKKIFKNYSNRILKVKEFCSEYGKQVILENIIKREKFQKNCLEFPHFLTITIFHHPLGWLEESQKYDYENGGKTKFMELLELSDVLLTGHEHVNINITPEILFDHTIHIPGGMFIQDKHRVEDGGQNRFAVLEFDRKNKFLDVINFIWDETSGIGEWKEYNVWNEKHKWRLDLNRKPTYFLTKNNLEVYKNIFKEKFKVDNYIRKFMPLNMGSFEVREWVIEKSTNDLEIYKYNFYKHKSEVFLCIQILISGKELYDVRKGHSEKLSLLFKKFVQQNNRKTLKKHIVFIQSDIITEPLQANDYFSDWSSSKSMKLLPDSKIHEIYHDLQKTADFKFNLFRNDFFYQFESVEFESVKNRNKENFRLYVDLRFTNYIVPFWVYSNYT